MRTPLRYQISEYDCGPTSILNAFCYLFDRDTILPTVIKTVIGGCNDAMGEMGAGTAGTTGDALRGLASWLNDFGKRGDFPVSARYIAGKDAEIRPGSWIESALTRPGAAVVFHCFLGGGHYVLLTDIDEDCVYLFDPYYDDAPITMLDRGDVRKEYHPFEYNRVVTRKRMNEESYKNYAIGPLEYHKAMLVYNTKEYSFDYMI